MSELIDAILDDDQDLALDLIDKRADVNSKSSGYTPLTAAATTQNLAICRHLIDNGANISLLDDNGNTPIAIAADVGNLELCLYFQSVGADIGYLKPDLYIAALFGNLKECQNFVDRGDSVDVQNYSGKTPLFIAAKNNHKDVVAFLVGKKANLKIQNNSGIWPLYVAAENGHLEICQLLVSKGDDSIETISKNGLSPLMAAKKAGHFEIVKIFTKGKSSTNLHPAHLPSKPEEISKDILSKDDTCTGLGELFSAIRNVKMDLLHVLVDQDGKDINTPLLGSPAICSAIFTGDLNLCKFLIDRGAILDCKTKEGEFPLLLAAKKGYLEICKLILERNTELNINQATPTGSTALHMASQYGFLETVKFLVTSGANVNSVTQFGSTPLYIAVNYGHITVVEYLLASGGNPNGTKTAIPLCSAASHNRLDICELLINAGARADGEGKGTTTPLNAATLSGNLDICKLLVDKGGNIDTPDQFGQTPRSIAKEKFKSAISNYYQNFPVGYDLAEMKIRQEEEKEKTRLLKLDQDKEKYDEMNNLLTLLSKDDIKAGLGNFFIAAANDNIDLVRKYVAEGKNVNSILKTKETPLLIAARYGNFEVCKILIAKGAKVNALDINGTTPLYVAAEKGYIEVCKYLSSFGAKLMERYDGSTALHAATTNNHLEVCQFLIQCGANPDLALKSKRWVTPRQIAKEKGFSAISALYETVAQHSQHALSPLTSGISIVEQSGIAEEWNTINLELYSTPNIEQIANLIDQGADINFQREGDGYTPFIVAAGSGWLEAVKFYVQRKVNIDLAGNNGLNALLLACHNGHFEVCKYLISVGANVNATRNNGASALCLAAQFDRLEMCNYLLANGAQVDLAMNDKCTPLFIAAQLGHLEICKSLLINGAKINRLNVAGATALYVAAQNGNLHTLKLLIACGAKVDQTRDDGSTALTAASLNGKLNCCKQLLFHGASIDVKNINGETPLFLAAQHGKLEVCKFLAMNGANIDCLNNIGHSPFYIACFKGLTDVCQFLLSKGAQVELQSNSGSTPLYVAAQEGHLDICKILVSKGANINANSKGKLTPLMIAKEQKRDDIVAYFETMPKPLVENLAVEKEMKLKAKEEELQLKHQFEVQKAEAIKESKVLAEIVSQFKHVAESSVQEGGSTTTSMPNSLDGAKEDTTKLPQLPDKTALDSSKSLTATNDLNLLEQKDKAPTSISISEIQAAFNSNLSEIESQLKTNFLKNPDYPNDFILLPVSASSTSTASFYKKYRFHLICSHGSHLIKCKTSGYDFYDCQDPKETMFISKIQISLLLKAQVQLCYGVGKNDSIGDICGRAMDYISDIAALDVFEGCNVDLMSDMDEMLTKLQSIDANISKLDANDGAALMKHLSNGVVDLISTLHESVTKFIEEKDLVKMGVTRVQDPITKKNLWLCKDHVAKLEPIKALAKSVPEVKPSTDSNLNSASASPVSTPSGERKKKSQGLLSKLFHKDKK